MSIDPRKYIEVDKRFPDSMAGDANRVLTVKADESGYEHSGAVTVEHVVGAIIMWPLDTPPQGYLLCDGAEYDIATYPHLGALLGENAPGSGKFNVPDISFAKNSRGVNTGQIEPSSVGEHGHDIDPAPHHSHTATVSSVGNHNHYIYHSGNHQHRLARPMFFSGGSYTDWGFDNTHSTKGPTYTDAAGNHRHDMENKGAHSHTATVSKDGAHGHKVHDHGVGQETQPTCTLVNFCIRT